MSNGKIKIIELSEDALEQKLAEAREEGWRFANDCYVKPLPAIAEWLENEKRYPHGMTYAEAYQSFEEFKEGIKMNKGLVIWGEEMPDRCDQCPCFDSEYNQCNVIDFCPEHYDDPIPKDCPLEAINRENLKK